MPSDPLFEVRFREFEVALKELNERCEVEKVERWKKLDAELEQLEIDEWKRRFHVVNEEANKKYDAEKEELEKKCKAEKEPFQMHQVTVSSIPKVLIQKSHHFESPQKGPCLKFTSEPQRFQSRKCPRFCHTGSLKFQSSHHQCNKS